MRGGSAWGAGRVLRFRDSEAGRVSVGSVSDRVPEHLHTPRRAVPGALRRARALRESVRAKKSVLDCSTVKACKTAVLG